MIAVKDDEMKNRIRLRESDNTKLHKCNQLQNSYGLQILITEEPPLMAAANFSRVLCNLRTVS